MRKATKKGLWVIACEAISTMEPEAVEGAVALALTRIQKATLGVVVDVQVNALSVQRAARLIRIRGDGARVGGGFAGGPRRIAGKPGSMVVVTARDASVSLEDLT